jgi:antitoxin YefM
MYKNTYNKTMTKLPRILSISEARAALKDLVERVTADKAPAIITRQGGEPVVMVALSEWEALQETNYLLESPANARRLRDSIAAAEAGETRSLTPDTLRRLAADPAVFIGWAGTKPVPTRHHECRADAPGARRPRLAGPPRNPPRQTHPPTHRRHSPQPVRRPGQTGTPQGRIVRLVVAPHR